MNTLKKNIIYYYIVITFVLLAAEIYLFRLLFDNSSLLEGKTGIPEIVFECLGLVLGLLLFGMVSYYYYRKISGFIQEETKKQVKERNLLFANIAHDLKNPISSVLGFARALEENAVLEDEKQIVYRTISGKSLQVDDMIQKMFLYAKMESEGYSLCLSEQDICGIVRECTALRYNDIESRNIDLDVSIPDVPILKSIDKAEFTRVLDNLISNALKHNDEGIKMLIEIKYNGEKVKITVADSGCEIPDPMKEAVFQPFQCSDESRQAKDGSGLGLAIARRIAELHNGRLYIDDNIEGYTKAFVFEL